MAVSLGSINLKCMELVPIRKKVMVHHSIPDRDSDRLQNMGFNSRMFEITCETLGATKDSDKDTLEGYFDNDTSVTFTYGSDSYTVKVEEFQASENVSESKWEIKMVLVEDES
jgi:hypothetical protein